MEGYEESTYGDLIAPVYDDLYGEMEDVEPVTTWLAKRAGAGPALELAVGTGRVALPLSERGVEVHGIDVSEAMLAKLKSKPGADAVKIVVGDFSEVRAPRDLYSLVYVVFNTFFALVTQESQLRCFSNVATRLAPGGAFVIEAFVPDPSRFANNRRLSTDRVKLDTVWLESSVHDPVTQQITTQQIALTQERIHLFPSHLRYAWPSELDLMARLAGLRLAERWGGWEREPFTASSMKHISVYEPAPR
ncbi:class I SAM-dependent methyltransferase [soil metagenome]